MSNETVTMSVEYVRTHSGSILVDNGERVEWLPKNKIKVNSDGFNRGDIIEVEVPEWLAIDKGLV